MVNNFGGIPPAFGFDKGLPVGEGGSYVPKQDNLADVNPQPPEPVESPKAPPREDVYRPWGDGDPVGEGGSYVPKGDDPGFATDRIDINRKLFG